MRTNPLEALEEQHQHGLRELDRLAAALTKLEHGEALSPLVEEIREAVTFIDTEVRHHNQMEEEHLFPMLESVAPDSPVPIMLDEHRELWSALDAVQRCLPALDAAPDDEAERRNLLGEGFHICDLLRAHIEKEDTILFPMAQERLAPEQLEQLARALETETAED